MADPSLSTHRLQGCVDRLQAGDLVARDELLRRVGEGLGRLARKMLRRFPGVRPWADTGDVFQGATLRLLRAIQEFRPADARHIFNLAAEQMRRELVDLSRHFYGPFGQGANHGSVRPHQDTPGPAHEPLDSNDDADNLLRWGAFHTTVAQLPAEEREVVALAFYHGWTQAEIGELFAVDERAVRRRWQSACLQLERLLGADLARL
jgi:RNA polymerase sigma-70 factor (ECF subfamily)